jgi:hypothetical protein
VGAFEHAFAKVSAFAEIAGESYSNNSAITGVSQASTGGTVYQVQWVFCHFTWVSNHVK